MLVSTVDFQCLYPPHAYAICSTILVGACNVRDTSVVTIGNFEPGIFPENRRHYARDTHEGTAGLGDGSLRSEITSRPAGLLLVC